MDLCVFLKDLKGFLGDYFVIFHGRLLEGDFGTCIEEKKIVLFSVEDEDFIEVDGKIFIRFFLQ